VAIKFFKNKRFYLKTREKFIDFEKLDCIYILMFCLLFLFCFLILVGDKPVKVYNLSNLVYDYSHYNMIVVEYPLWYE
jgi:hypothetical protein